MRAESAVIEYFENYFGDTLNEDTSDEDIMNAVYDLVELCDVVCDAVGLEETAPSKPRHYKWVRDMTTTNKKGNIHYPGQAVNTYTIKPSREAEFGGKEGGLVVKNPGEYARVSFINREGRPSPTQSPNRRDFPLSTPIPAKYATSTTPIRTLKPTSAPATPDNSPILQTGQGTNTKTVRPSDIQAKKRAKRIKRMKKFGK